MMWLQAEDMQVADTEWSALVIHIMSIFLVLGEYATPGIAELRVLMAQIARWLRWHEFASYYEMGLQEELENRYDNVLAIEIPPPQSMGKSYDVIEWISTNFTGGDRTDFLTLAFARQKGVPDSSRQSPTDTRWGLMTPRTHMFKSFFSKLRARNDAVGIVEAMYSSGIDVRVLETLPEAILTPLRDAIANCQARPPSSWSKDMLKLVSRSDITLMYEPSMKLRQRPFNITAPIHIASWDFRTICQTLNEFNSAGYDDGEGTERQAVIRALFKEDRRLNEAQDLLFTHRPRIVRLDLEPGWTESQYLEKQKELVSRVATGTLAIPAGRALLYYGLRYPLLTQKFHIGGFNLNCITTGIMGIGLLYCGSQHRRMSEIMMSEIEHVGEDESPEPLRSECYRLAAGFSLGFINLGKGKDLKGLHDMRLTEKLIGIATANKKVEMVQILDRAAAGAVMALALIFMKSEDHIVARKIDVPESVLQFDYIRPDILLLRTVAKNLILWSQIEPSFEWIAQTSSQVFASL
ncbi:hypothetical protein ACHAP6_007371 [Verticillium nonalfalfae]